MADPQRIPQRRAVAPILGPGAPQKSLLLADMSAPATTNDQMHR